MTEHSGRTHSRFSASGSYRWLACAGSMALSDTVPVMEQVASGYALDGEQAHELLEYALAEGHRNAAQAYVAGKFTWIHYYDDFMDRIDSIQTALDYVWTTVEENGPNCRMWVECRFQFPTSTGQDAGGTSDVVLYFPDYQLLYVIDFKHGAGHAVEVEHNPQLKFYMVGVLTEIGRNGLRVGMIAGTIIQPRAPHSQGPIREWVCDMEELTQFQKEVDDAIRASMVPGAPRTPGEHCTWCPAAVKCPEFETSATRNVAAMFSTFKQVAETKRLPTPQEVPIERLGEVLEWGKIVRDWYEMMLEYAKDLARHGYQIPNRKLVYTHARRKWDLALPEEKIAKTLADLIGVPLDEVYPRTLIGITDAETQIKNAVREIGGSKQAVSQAREAMAYLTVKEPSNNLTLVGMDDKRPAVTSEELFKHIQLRPLLLPDNSPIDPQEP